MPALPPKLLRFEPVYQERVWGGRKLETMLGRRLPKNAPIGESWEIVDRPEAQSHVAGGPWAGRALHDLLNGEAGAVMGPKWKPERRFPVLVKWLDAREKMSLQVHPPARVAGKLGGEPKSENWYIAEAEEGAAVIAGLKNGVTRKEFENELQVVGVSNEGRPISEITSLLHRIKTRKGDSLFVPSGRLHAIDAGNLILEIQQNSDTTYRVYDWGRVGLDGKLRALHVAESLQSIDFADVEPAAIPAGRGEAVLADCEHFRLRRVPLEKGATLSFSANEQPRIISVAEGRVGADEPSLPELERGANVLAPYAESVKLRALEPSLLLVTENFA